jgi:hypothetical protein
MESLHKRYSIMSFDGTEEQWSPISQKENMQSPLRSLQSFF